MPVNAIFQCGPNRHSIFQSFYIPTTKTISEAEAMCRWDCVLSFAPCKACLVSPSKPKCCEDGFEAGGWTPSGWCSWSWCLSPVEAVVSCAFHVWHFFCRVWPQHAVCGQLVDSSLSSLRETVSRAAPSFACPFSLGITRRFLELHLVNQNSLFGNSLVDRFTAVRKMLDQSEHLVESWYWTFNTVLIQGLFNWQWNLSGDSSAWTTSSTLERLMILCPGFSVSGRVVGIHLSWVILWSSQQRFMEAVFGRGSYTPGYFRDSVWRVYIGSLFDWLARDIILCGRCSRKLRDKEPEWWGHKGFRRRARFARSTAPNTARAVFFWW